MIHFMVIFLSTMDRCNFAEELYVDCGRTGHAKVQMEIAHQMMELFTNFAKFG